MAHAAERGLVWSGRWQSAVRVVERQCRRIQVVQFPIVWLFHLSAISSSKLNVLLVVNVRGVNGTSGGAWVGVV